MTGRYSLEIILEDGLRRFVGEYYVEVANARDGAGPHLLAGALHMPTDGREAIFETLVALINTPAAFRIVTSARTWRGRYFVDTLHRAGGTGVCELSLASTGAPIELETSNV